MSRDMDFLRSLDEFGQLCTPQILRAHFSDSASKTSYDRMVSRLVERKFILHMGQRMVKGKRGSGPAVFQLGPNGWLALDKRGKYRVRFEAVSEHRLRVADVFSEACKLEDAGVIKILGYSTEPDSHAKIAGVTVRADLLMHLWQDGEDGGFPLWIEVDLGTENRTEIQRKVADYITIFDWATQDEIETIPEVLFLSTSERGVEKLQSFMYGKLKGKRLFGPNQAPRDYSDKIQVHHIDNFAEYLA